MNQPSNSLPAPAAQGILLIILMLGGCTLLQSDPVPPAPPPAPEIAFARGENPGYLARQFERDSKGAITGFKGLTRAEAAVAAAQSLPDIQNIAGDELAQAQTRLDAARELWAQIKSSPRADPKRLAQVDHEAYMATRWAQVASAEAGVEAGLTELVAAQQTLERQQQVQQREQRADARWLNQQLIPETAGSIKFALGTSRLTEDSQAVVKKAADFLQQNPQFGLKIAGHTDSSPPSDANLQAFLARHPDLQSQDETAQTRAYNLQVSRERAQALAQALIAQGINGQRLQVQGYGQTQPIADNATAQGRRQNRRVTATVIDLSSGPEQTR